MQRVEAIPFGSFKEKIKLTSALSKLGRVYLIESFVIVEYWEDKKMSRGRKLTRKEKEFLSKKGYDPVHYLKLRKGVYIHRATGRTVDL